MAGEDEEVKLIGSWPMPYVMRPRIALNLKSVSYEYLEEQLGTKSELLLKSNPVYKRMPVLIHNKKPICESMIIVEYIDEVWSSSGPSILPSDPYDRAIARFWAAYADDKFFPTVRSLVGVEEEEARKAVLGEIAEGLAFLEEAFKKCSKGKDFFGGDQIGYVDIVLGSYLGWLKVSEKVNDIKLFDEGKTPGLLKWSENFCSNDAVKDVMHDFDKLYEIAVNVMIPKYKESSRKA